LVNPTSASQEALMRRATLVGILAVLIATALAAPAAADPRLAARTGGLVLDPQLAGDRLFFGERRGSRMRLVVAAPGATPRIVGTGPLPGSSFDDDESPGEYSRTSLELAASAERLAYGESRAAGNARYQQGVSSLTHFTGTPVTELGQVDSCHNGDPFSPASPTTDVDGARVASTDCTGSVVIRDHSAGGAVVASFSPGERIGAGDLALAGRYVAYNPYGIGPFGTTPGTTVVHDWVANTKVYEIPRVARFDLQDDATLAAVSTSSRCASGKLSWFSAAEPTEHVLPVVPCVDSVRIAAGRVMAVAETGAAQRALALVGLDGNRTDVARLGADGMLVGTPDFDGARVSYALRNCAGGIDLLVEDATRPQPRDEPRSCPARVRSGSAAIGPTERTAPVFLECERGCVTQLSIRMRVDGRLRHVASRRVRIRPDDPCVAEPLPFELKLASDVRREVRERRAVSGHVFASAPDRTGDVRVTKRRFTLRAARRDRDVMLGDCAE
jgi:hypothetical protein